MTSAFDGYYTLTMDSPSVITVPRWTGREARLLRLALRMSQREYAAFLGAGARTIAHWDMYPEVVPRPEWQAALDTSLLRAGAAVQQRFEVMFKESDAGELPDPRSSPSEPTSVGWRGHAQGDQATYSAVETLDNCTTRGAVNENDIAVIQGMLVSLSAADHQFGGGFAQRTANCFMLEVVRPRLQAPGRTELRNRLSGIAAEFEMRIAWMCLDVADAHGARSAARDAFRLAQDSDDLATCSWVMSMCALQETWLSNPRRAIAYGQAAIGLASSAPTLVKAFAQGKLARALATSGDRHGTIAALTTARSLFELASGANDGVPSTIRDTYSSAYLLDEEAHCYRDLGEDQLALSLSEQSLSLRGPDRFARNRAFATGNAALSWARLGQLEKACAEANSLLELASTLDSRRVVERVGAALEALRPHATTSPVLDLFERARMAAIPGITP